MGWEQIGASSDGLNRRLRTVAEFSILGVNLTANAGPVPPPFAIMGQTNQMEYYSTKTVPGERECHLSSFRAIPQAHRFLGSWYMSVAFMIFAPDNA